MKTSKLLAVVIVLQGLILAGQWTGGRDYLPHATAQVPDPANRQLQMIDELKDLNTKLAKIADLIYAQNYAIANGKTTYVNFDVANNKYSILSVANSAGDTYLSHPIRQINYVTKFGPAVSTSDEQYRIQGFETATIDSAVFN